MSEETTATETQEAPEAEQEVVDENNEEIEENAEQDESSEVSEESEESDGEESPEADPEPPKTFKQTINGEEVELTIEQLQTLASRASGSEKKFQDAFHAREKITKAYEELKNNPFEVMEKLGKDPRKAAEEYLTEIILREEMNDEQKAAYADRKKVEKYEQQEKDNAKSKSNLTTII